MSSSISYGLTEQPTFVLEPARLKEFSEASEWRALVDATGRVSRLLAGHVVWAVSARSRSGGLAASLQSLVAFARGAGVDARWAVIAGSEDFFRFVRLLQDNLHGEEGERDRYGDGDLRLYEETLAKASERLREQLVPGDVVLLHDPPSAGMIPAIKDAGARAIWRCRMGSEVANEPARRAQAFLAPYTQLADVCVFGRRQFVWGADGRGHVMLPSLSPISPNNQELSPTVVSAILAAAGLQTRGSAEESLFERIDGSPGRVDRKVKLIDSAPLDPAAEVILQISQWNRLSDPGAVLDWYDEHVAPRTAAHIVLAGPELRAVADDPRAPAILDDAISRLRARPSALRERIHLATLPSEDPEESAAVLNALERRSAVVLQKSRGEGSGMTVLEGMWKRRPIVCSRVGVLQDHVIEGVTGFIRDPHDLEGLADATLQLLADADLRQRMGAAGHDRIRRHFLLPRELADWAALIETLLRTGAPGGGNQR